AVEPPLDEPLTLRLDATLAVDCVAQAALAWWLEHAAACSLSRVRQR
ncbi:hypothetical protein ACPTI6_31720, partial [Pseudomonas aeruginosa]